jgi:hypothetical protein
MRMRDLRRSCLLLLPPLLAGCAGAPAAPPLTSLLDRPCAEKLDLAAPHPVQLDGREVPVDFAAAAACWDVGGRRSAYAVFVLPSASEPYLASITSRPVGTALLSPRALILDERGETVRELKRDSFLSKGAALSASFRARPDERYLVVASDPGSVGTDVSQISGSISSTMVAAGPVFTMVHSGTETTQRYTYAHNGLVAVSAQPVPKVN